MILIGTMEWASTRLRGMFSCPNCGSNEKFRLRASRPFLTLYFIPIIPIGGLQEFVQCSSCKNAFEKEVLALGLVATRSGEPKAADSQDVAFVQDLQKIVALMMVEDGHVTEEEISVGRRVYRNMTGDDLSREDLGRMCGFVQQQRLRTPGFLATAGSRRNHEEKLLIVQAMFAVAGADGEISSGRLQSLVRAQKILGLDEAEFQRAIVGTSQWL